MAELKKRYRIQVTQLNGRIVNTFTFDLESAVNYAKKIQNFRRVQVFAVYSKKRSNTYMDTDDYSVLVDEWEKGEL